MYSTDYRAPSVQQQAHSETIVEPYTEARPASTNTDKYKASSSLDGSRRNQRARDFGFYKEECHQAQYSNNQKNIDVRLVPAHVGAFVPGKVEQDQTGDASNGAHPVKASDGL